MKTPLAVMGGCRRRFETIALIALHMQLAAAAPLSFESPALLPTVVGPYQMVAGDFNGDPFPDFAVVNTGAWTSGSGGNCLSVFPGNGDGTFQARLDHTTGAFPVGIATGDLNGDGAADLIAVNRRPAGGNSWLSIFLNKNDGTGGFLPEQQVPSGVQPMHAAIGRLNEDQIPDIAVAVHGGNKIQILIGNGDGTFSEPTPRITAGNGPTGILIADVNKDGKADVAATNWYAANISIYLGNGDGTFSEHAVRPGTGNRCWNLAADDFNGDGNPDLAAPSALDGAMSVLLGNGDGTFQPQAAFAMGANCYDLAAVDIDLDGHKDLVTASSGLRIFGGNGDGTFHTPPQVVAATSDANPSPAVADFNGDSAYDVVVTNTAANSVSVVLQSTPPPGKRGPFFTLLPPVTQAPDAGRMAEAVAIDGNLAAVGCPGDSMNTGTVRVFDARDGRMLHHIPSPDAAFPGMGDFGGAVALCGNLLVVGARGAEVSSLIMAGKVHVFDLSGPAPATPVLTFSHPNPEMGGFFGDTVAVAGRRIMVGYSFRQTVLVYDLDSQTPGVPVTTLINPDPAFGGFGSRVAASGDRLVVTAGGAAWAYQFGATISVTRLDNPVPPGVGNFGYSVALSGTKVVIGDPADDTAAENSGCVHVYDLAGPAPGTALATCRRVSAKTNEFLGTSVAICGTKVIAGVPYCDVWGENSGSAWVFESSGAEALAIHNPEPSPQDGFGSAMAASADRLVIGAILGDSGAAGAGCAYSYDLKRLNAAAPVAALNRGAPSSGGHHGKAVAATGTRVIIGMPDDDTGAENAGRIFIHDLSAGNPLLPAMEIPNPAPEAGDSFGEALAVSGNLLAVGAPGEDTGAANAGSVYVFNLGGATPTVPVHILNNPAPGTDDHFGAAVAIHGNKVVVGACMDDTVGGDEGSAYVYDLAGGTPTVPVLTLSNPDPGLGSGDWFGAAVGISGNHVVIGAPNSSGDESGTAYLYDTTSAAPETPVVMFDPPGSIFFGARFGSAVALSGEYAVIGNPGGGSDQTGRAGVYDLANPGPGRPFLTLVNPDPQPEDNFGAAVGISGNRVVVGAPGDGPSGGLQRDAMLCLYVLSDMTPDQPQAVLRNPRPATVDHFGAEFGHSVAVSGSVVAAGAPMDDGLTTDAGAAHVFIVPEVIVWADGLVATGGALDMGQVAPGSPFTRYLGIRNTGEAPLTLAGIGVAGGNAGDFAVVPPADAVLTPGDDSTFNATFTPSASGFRSTYLQLVFDDIYGSTYDIRLTGTGLSEYDDTDGDGLNDVAEYRMNALGFFWNYAQPHLVDSLFRNADAAGLYQAYQTRSIRLTTPGIIRNAATHRTRLTAHLDQAVDSGDFEDLPSAPADVSVNPAGGIGVGIDMPEGTMFLRIETK